MSLLRSIVHGFGFTLGARAADEMLEELAKEDAAVAAPAPVHAKSARELAAAEKAAKRAAKKRESDIERELRALKKRVARER